MTDDKDEKTSLEISETSRFIKRSGKKPKDLQLKMYKQIDILRDNPRYPSLRIKKVQGTGSSEIWEASIDIKHRMTFEYTEDNTGILLRNCNGHEVFDNP